MKRGNKVLNARQVRDGRNLLRWGAAGMNWAPGADRDVLMEQSRSLLGRGAAFAAAFAQAANLAADDGCLTQTSVSAAIRAAFMGKKEAERMASEWEAIADERDASRPWNAGWTYDAETESCLRIAAAIRAAGELQ